MATRDYWFAFGSGSPSTNTGLAPTFISFVNGSGQTIAPPSITETYAGTGLYKASYQATQTICFVLDGATTGLASADRYIAGVFDPNDLFGVTLSASSVTLAAIGLTLTAQGSTLVGIGNTGIALGTTAVAQNVGLLAQGVTLTALGNTTLAQFGPLGTSLSAIGLLIGSTASSYGSTSTDPSDVLGFLKRAQEFMEGNQVYTKSTGILDFFSRGSTTLLREKTVSDTSTITTKT